MVSAQPASTAIWRSSTLGSSAMALMSQRSQRLSCAVTAHTPLCNSAAGGGDSGLLIMNTVGLTGGFGNAWSRFATPRVMCRYRYWSSPELRAMSSLISPVHSPSLCGFGKRMPSRLCCKRRRCSARRNALREYTGITSYTPSPKMKPRSSTEILASSIGMYSPFR